MARGQTPQALLIHGPAGIGRRHFALALAARLLGSAWRPSLEVPADQLDGVPHPDYWNVGLEEESRVIKIDQIRELIQALSLTSHRSGWKVGLIWPAELMNHNAANTLLKTLEEPPAATTLILIADAPAPPSGDDTQPLRANSPVAATAGRRRSPGSPAAIRTGPPASGPWHSRPARR